VAANPANLGPVRNFNTGIHATGAELVVKLDGDDYLLPEFLDRCHRVLSAHPDAAFVFTQTYRSREGRLCGLWLPWSQDRRLTGRDFFLEALRHGNPCASCSVMFRRTAFVAAGRFQALQGWSRLPLCEDLYLWLRLATLRDVLYLSEPLAVYTDHDSGITGSIRRPFSRQPLRYKAEAVEDAVNIAFSRDTLREEDRLEATRLLAREWISAADMCAFLPADRNYCLRRAFQRSACTTLASRHFWRLGAKLLLGLRLTEALRRLTGRV
jgi:glycosyltransferase involved in cell wall biosynthesis